MSPLASILRAFTPGAYIGFDGVKVSAMLSAEGAPDPLISEPPHVSICLSFLLVVISIASLLQICDTRSTFVVGTTVPQQLNLSCQS